MRADGIYTLGYGIHKRHRILGRNLGWPKNRKRRPILVKKIAKFIGCQPQVQISRVGAAGLLFALSGGNYK